MHRPIFDLCGMGKQANILKKKHYTKSVGNQKPSDIFSPKI